MIFNGNNKGLTTTHNLKNKISLKDFDNISAKASVLKSPYCKILGL